jgi:glycosyltransferase involved in cell wall biosynthesis
MHSLDLADYQPGGGADGAAILSRFDGLTAGYILVIGNHYPHKFLRPTVSALTSAFPDRTVVAFGLAGGNKTDPAPPKAGRQYEPDAEVCASNLYCIQTGNLTNEEVEAITANASVVVFPSHYEGFGFPVLDALGAGKPVLARRTSVSEEIWDALGGNPNFYLYETTGDLVRMLETIPQWIAPWHKAACFGAADSAAKLRAGIDDAIANISYTSLVKRIRAVQHANSVCPSQMDAAHRVGSIAERIAAKAFRTPLIYAAARLAYRYGRSGWRWLRKVGTRIRAWQGS